MPQQYKALTVALNSSLEPFSIFLNQHGIIHKVCEYSGQLVIFVFKIEDVEAVKQLHALWQNHPKKQHTMQATPTCEAFNTGVYQKLWLKVLIGYKRYPFTIFFMVAGIFVALVTQVGQAQNVLFWWSTFLPKYYYQASYFADSVARYDYHFLFSYFNNSFNYWRLLTPIFLHFGMMHLLFNLFWLFQFGHVIEKIEGSKRLGCIVFLTAIFSNCVQFLWSPAHVFGGYSGVIYGLVGYCFFKEKIDKNCRFGFIPGLYIAMIIFWAIGILGLFKYLLGINVANAAHTGGLFLGSLLGIGFGLLGNKIQTK